MANSNNLNNNLNNNNLNINLNNNLNNIRYEFYQTENELVLSLFIKNTQPEHIQCQLNSNSIHLIHQNNSSAQASLHLHPLSHEIDPDLSSWKSLPSKVEIRLKKKLTGIKWNKIETQQDFNSPIPPVAKQVSPVPVSIPSENLHQSAYPSSSRRKTNWDTLAKSVDKEEEEAIKNLSDPNAGGDRALNELFQKLYADATDDQKKAMMKSYVESNGTALSTDWSDVGKKKVETRPPESMVAKSWKA